MSRSGWIASSAPALLISLSEGMSIPALKARFREAGVVSAILLTSAWDRRYEDIPQLFESCLA